MTIKSIVAKLHKDCFHWYVYACDRNCWCCVGNYTCREDAVRRVDDIRSNVSGCWVGVSCLVIFKTHEIRECIDHDISFISK